MTKYSVIVPTYNERRNIGISVPAAPRGVRAPRACATDEFEIVDGGRQLPRRHRGRGRRVAARVSGQKPAVAAEGGQTGSRDGVRARPDARHRRVRDHHGCGPVPPPLGDPAIRRRAARVRVRRGHGDSVRAWGRGARLGHAPEADVPGGELHRARAARAGGERPDRLVPPVPQRRHADDACACARAGTCSRWKSWSGA